MEKYEIINFLGTLNDSEREALEIAALMGSRFFLDHVLDLGNIKPSKLLELFDKMIDVNFLRNEFNVAKGAFSFKFKILPDIIVDAMNKDRKKYQLSNIIDYMERELVQDNKKPLILAELLLKFRNQDDSFQYTKRAADLLLSKHKTERALTIYKEIIDSLLEVNKKPLDKLILVDSVISYTRIAVNIIPVDEILHLIMKTLPIAEELNNVRAMAMLKLWLGKIYQHSGDFINAATHYKEGWMLAENSTDKDLMKTASKFNALSFFWQGRMASAVKMYEDTLGSVEGISPGLLDFWASLMLAYCYGNTGRLARGLGLAEALRQKALSTGELKNQAYADAIIALIMLEYRHVKKAEPYINNAIAMGEKLHNDLVLFMAKPCKAFVMYTKGNLDSAKQMLQSGLSHARNLGQIHYPSPWVFDILWSLHKAKREPIDGYTFQSEIARLKKWPDIYMKGVALRYEAREKFMISNEGEDDEDIEALLKQSHELLGESGAKIELGRTQVDLAKFYIMKKDIVQARQFANIAYVTFNETDKNLFPPELSFLIKDKSLGNRMLKYISELRDAADYLSDSYNYFGKVVNIITDIFGAERAAILLMKEDRNLDNSLQIVATRSFDPEELSQFDNEPLRTIMRRTLQNKDPLVIDDMKKNSEFKKFSATSLSQRSLACIPLIIQGQSAGLIYIDNRLLEGAFTVKDLPIMTSIGSQVAFYIKTNIPHEDIYSPVTPSKKAFSYPEKEKFNNEFPQIVGKSKAIRDILSNIKKVSNTDATVLISGETGVGKELIAKSVHQTSSRAEKAFVAVNISALSENILPSEMFGHEKGSFTGAEKTKPGRFEMAHLGTIFLDEIGDLSLDSQARLLRVLQEGKFERVGGTHTIHSDFRLIAATNRNLAELVARGIFRSDLYFRIGTFPIEVPPLRERKEDIASLVHHFLPKYAAKHRKNVPHIDEYEMKKLLEYPWPGNIRELEHVIERALILSDDGNLLFPEFIMSSITAKENQKQAELLPLDEISRRHIVTVLNHVKWRIRGKGGAAEILGLKPTTLEFRIKKLGIKA